MDVLDSEEEMERDFNEEEMAWLVARSKAMHAELDVAPDEEAWMATKARHDEANAEAFLRTFGWGDPVQVKAHIYWAEPVRRDPGLVHRMLGGILGPETKP